MTGHIHIFALKCKITQDIRLDSLMIEELRFLKENEGV